MFMDDSPVESRQEIPINITLFEQYKLYVNTSLEITRRRTDSNKYFLTINTFLFAALGGASAAGLGVLQIGWTLFVSIAGVLLCYYWFRLIESYKGLNNAKFKIIHRMEEYFPVKLFAEEWELLGEGKDHTKYRPITSIEMKTPWIFAILYIVLLVWSVIETACV